MSVTIAKGGKRTMSAPTPRRTSASTAVKGRSLARKSAPAKPLPKKASAYKAPPKKATKTVVTAKPKPAKAAAKPVAKKPMAAKVAPKKAAPVKKPLAKPIKETAKSKITKPAPKKPITKAGSKPVVRVKTKAPVKAAVKLPAKTVVNVVAKKPAAKVTKPPQAAPVRAKAPAPIAPKPVVKPVLRQPTMDEAAALRAFESARREFGAGHFSEARTQFKMIVDKYPGISEIAARARTYLTITESRLRADASLPRDADSLYDRGVIELNRGDFVAAQEMFERALKKEPEAAHIFYGLAATRARLGALELALQSLQRALDIQPNLRVRAQHDHDLQALRNEPEFETLIFGTRQ